MNPKDDKPVEIVAPPQQSALAKALSKATDLITDDDFNAPKEPPPLRYLCIRQKELRGDGGKIIREPGKFRTGAIDDVTFEDREELQLSILAFVNNRVYFEKMTDREPTCKSIDMIHGSRPREGNRYGVCLDINGQAGCSLALWGSKIGGGQACRENRKLFAFDWGTEKPMVLTVGVSSLSTWAKYCEYVDDQARVLRRKDGSIPFTHHLMMVPVTTQYKAEPAGHFIVKFGDPIALPGDIQERMAKLRKEAMAKFNTFVETYKEEAEDFVGSGETTK